MWWQILQMTWRMRLKLERLCYACSARPLRRRGENPLLWPTVQGCGQIGVAALEVLISSLAFCFRGPCCTVFDSAGLPWRWSALETGRPTKVKSEAIAKHVALRSRVDRKNAREQQGRGVAPVENLRERWGVSLASERAGRSRKFYRNRLIRSISKGKRVASISPAEKFRDQHPPTARERHPSPTARVNFLRERHPSPLARERFFLSTFDPIVSLF